MPFPVLLVVHLPTVIFYFLSQLSSFRGGGDSFQLIAVSLWLITVMINPVLSCNQSVKTYTHVIVTAVKINIKSGLLTCKITI